MRAVSSSQVCGREDASPEEAGGHAGTDRKGQSAEIGFLSEVVG
jgi:hypothetical protein